MAIAACELDFDTPIRNGIGEGVTEDGKVDACVMQRAWLRAWCRDNPGHSFREIIDERIPDSEPTTSPVIARFLISLNDGLPDEPRQRLKPYEQLVLGTKTTDADEERRAWLCTDWIVRTFAPAWLRKAGLTAEADALVALPELHSVELAEAANPIITQAKDAAARAARDAWAAWAARDARDAWAARAARDAWAAWAARDARDAWAARAARDARAAWDAWAARAAWDARDAWDARAAGSDSVLAIGYAAAKGKPTYEEARAAAEAALAETTAELESGLFDLLDRMIAVGQAVPA
jgi:hypothetical protein